MFMSYVGRRVFVIPKQMVGVVTVQSNKGDVKVWFAPFGGRYWFRTKDVRLWTLKRSRECGMDANCWCRYEY